MSIVRGEVTEIKFELEQSRQENGESIDRAALLKNSTAELAVLKQWPPPVQEP